MTTAMPWDKTRTKLIRDKIRDAKDDEAHTISRLKLTIKGVTSLQPVYRFELRDLLFNKSNGRIRSEVLDKEASLGRSLDASTPEDQASIRSFLLSLRKDENEKIKNDLRSNGQLQPGIITCDGTVVNGNRRKALLEELFEETHDEKFKYLEAHVLPKDISKSELWLIEAGIQLSAPQQLDYSPINTLLKLREGMLSGLTVEQMASRIYGVDVDKIRNDLERLALIDEYLEFFLEKPERYHLVHNYHEHFIDTQNILARLAKNRSRTKLDWDAGDDDVNELKLVCFYYIRAKYSHMRIRDLYNLFCHSVAWQEVRGVVDLPSASPVSVDGEVVPDDEPDEPVDDDSAVDDIEEPSVVADEVRTENDRRSERAWRDATKEALHSKYEDAKERSQIAQNSQQPLVLAKRAWNNIKAIKVSKKTADVRDIDKLLAQSIKKINTLRKQISKLSR